jgi:hypothetical protein
MESANAITAHRVITAALGATWYRDTADDALSVASLRYGGTAVIERTTYALSGNVEVQVTLQLADGDVWSLATWADDDAYAMLTVALDFIARHAPATTEATA